MSIVFTKVRLIGAGTIDLPIVGALPTDGYILKNVDGLGPPDVDVYLGRTANAGGYYLGRSPINRQMVFTVGLNPNWGSGQTAADLRTALYGLLTPPLASDYVQVDLMNGASIVASTYGYVSKMVPNPFSKDPEMQITIDSPKTYLDGSIEHLTGLSKTAPVLINDATAPTGFYWEIALTANSAKFALTDSAGNELRVTDAFLSGDTIFFNTTPGSRGIYRVRSGVTTSLLGKMSAISIWHMLRQGNNNFTVDITTASAFTYTGVQFTQQFWGV